MVCDKVPKHKQRQGVCTEARADAAQETSGWASSAEGRGGACAAHAAARSRALRRRRAHPHRKLQETHRRRRLPPPPHSARMVTREDECVASIEARAVLYHTRRETTRERDSRLPATRITAPPGVCSWRSRGYCSPSPTRVAPPPRRNPSTAASPPPRRTHPKGTRKNHRDAAQRVPEPAFSFARRRATGPVPGVSPARSHDGSSSRASRRVQKPSDGVRRVRPSIAEVPPT